ncbi:DUF3016 domain-containing protein [Pseudoxanthomonas koreensis]|uniref:DUF3016 domain-containing protein n=1 Tax=Pseudoxanthomonas koreensis TaxID=266061 RepID=UPI0013907208|nr:DUF3016 domain-containing protein [Pseudoxanthomonas koreensis]KAF1694957.1 hypothetical protein CSC64_03785 [Pseudoxanthomonas koreensis]
MRKTFLIPLLAALAITPVHAARLVTDPDLPRALPADGPVSVEWTDPAEFSEVRLSHNRWESERGDWVTELARHLQKRAAARLPAGQSMHVVITDIERAGDFEPGRGLTSDHIRVMRDIYPPRMTLQVRITDTTGQVVSEGERRLVDNSFLMNSRPMETDPLQHEKRMIADWLRRELPASRGG